MSLSTLNGTFATFPLPEVLRLVAVSGETGRLKVESPTLSGRVYVVEGSIVYATTRAGDDLIDDLARLERITDEERDAIERRAVSLEDVRGTRKEVLDVFFKHQVSEVLVRLLGLPDGEFSFAHGVMMTHPVGFRFETEDALEAAEARSEQWREIKQVIPSVEAPYRMADEIAGTVTIDPDRWALLAMLPEVRSARGLAVKLKIFEFQAARQLADLAREGMIVEDSDAPRVKGAWHIQAVDRTSEDQTSEDQTSQEEMTEDEAAELLGSFMAIASRDDQGVDEAETEDVNEEEAEVDGDDGEDLTNRWKKLRTTRVADKKR